MKKITLIVFILFLGAAANAQVAVIANKAVPENSISNSQLKDIYNSNMKSWSNGSKILRFTLKADDDVSKKFFEAIGKPVSEMKKVWMKLQLTGEGKAPEALGSDDEVVNKVATTPGAIGYVDASKVNDKVKILITIK